MSIWRRNPYVGKIFTHLFYHENKMLKCTGTDHPPQTTPQLCVEEHIFMLVSLFMFYRFRVSWQYAVCVVILLIRKSLKSATMNDEPKCFQFQAETQEEFSPKRTLKHF